EIAATEKIYKSNQIPFIDSSAKSIEEIASVIMDVKNLRS
ncbi:MAG: Kinase/pyrophosphorylase, partial [Actinomycetota bacterium]